MNALKTKQPKENNWKVQSTPQDHSFFPTIGVSLWLGWNGGLFYLVIYLVCFASTFCRLFWLGIFLASMTLPNDFPKGYGKMLGGWIALQAEKYFALKTTLEDEQAICKYEVEGKAIIYALEPHDILPYGIFALNKTLRRFPVSCKNRYGLMTSAVFNLPIMKQMYTHMGASPVDKKTFRKHLERGESVGLVPGGVQEVIMMNPDAPEDLVLYLNSRKGFIKLALESGSPIVPMFAFNIDGSFGYWLPRGKFMEKIARFLGFLPVFFWGRWGIPFGIPRPQKLHLVVGKPIHIPCEGENVQVESVNKYHRIFLNEMESLYERHKVSEGYGNRTLKII